ncbi:MAG TPA: hypothetical protein DCO75_07285 [Fibrobacteres bacterium]|nr:hypothetical protein [Fibrobacterota bacterium]
MSKMKWLDNLSGLTASVPLMVVLLYITFFSTYAGIKDSAQVAHINFGTCTPSAPSSNARAKIDYNIFVCENAMKWDATESSQGNFSYTGGDAVANWTSTNDCYMRGHTMVWYAQTPSWVQSLTRQQMLAAMKNHITNLMTHFKGKILEWDICNECVADGSSSLRTSFWQQKIGNDFIDSAFTYAHAADSNVYLYYNDYSGENSGSTKSDYIYNMVKSMVQRKIPIHGVGLQCHLTAPVTKTAISANIKRIGDLGLRVSCTEIDIRNGATSPSSWTNLVQACVENYNATSILVWGFDDSRSWLGSSCACLPWDNSGQPRTSVISAIDAAFTGGDATINEKRAAFLKLSPEDILSGAGTPIVFNNAIAKKNLQTRFTFNNNVLSFSLPTAQNVQVRVFDIRGKMAGELNLGIQTAGMHTVHWAPVQLPDGMYFAKIRAGGQSLSILFTRMNKE